MLTSLLLNINSSTLTKTKAFTLIELMVSISITSILTTIVIANFGEFVVQMRVDNEISKLYRLLLITRNSAINSGNRAILCPLNANAECTTQWQNELSVFIDVNNNQRFDANDQETIIRFKEAITEGDSLLYGRGRNRVTYQPTGHLSGLANGTFRYCPSTYQNHARGIIVARSGRIYKTTDMNNDGFEENRSNNRITCN